MMLLTKINSKKTLKTFAFISIILLIQCKKETIESVECTGITPTYTTNVKSILDANCSMSGCHSASSKSSGYDLSSYSASTSAAGSSAFLGSIKHASGYSKMPKGKAKLTDSDIKTISCWVKNGMPE